MNTRIKRTFGIALALVLRVHFVPALSGQQEAQDTAARGKRKAAADWAKIGPRVFSPGIKVGEKEKKDLQRIPVTVMRTLHNRPDPPAHPSGGRRARQDRHGAAVLQGHLPAPAPHAGQDFPERSMRKSRGGKPHAR